jgi:hypothetical protein
MLGSQEYSERPAVKAGHFLYARAAPLPAGVARHGNLAGTLRRGFA